MITGTVNADLQAVVSLSLVGPSGHRREVEAIVDTGFNGFLTVPPAVVATLGLPRLGRGRAMLADGTEGLFDIHSVTVMWQNEGLIVEADATDTEVLIGMGLLEGCALSIHVESGGRVAAQPIA